jgi:uncharacterized protein
MKPVFACLVAALLATHSAWSRGADVSAEKWPCSFDREITDLPLGDYQTTALHAAVAGLRKGTIRRLLKGSTDPDVRDSLRQTALFTAVSDRIPEAKEIAAGGLAKKRKTEAQAKLEIARLLIAAGADVNAQDKNGETVLMAAVELPLLEPTGSRMVDLLLRSGSRVELRDHDGHTALSLAALRSNVAIAKTLMAHGADPNIRRCDGKSALDLARETKSDALIQALTR